MTKDEKIRLIKQIQRLCEKQYRKGFQHGFIACQNNELFEDQVNEFRLKGMVELYSKVEQPQTGKIENSYDRLLSEMQMPGVNRLRNLFIEAQNKS